MINHAAIEYAGVNPRIMPKKIRECLWAICLKFNGIITVRFVGKKIKLMLDIAYVSRYLTGAYG